MAKPWGRYILGFTRHAKFLALTGNAIALWWEAKNYCDENHTDGLFPKEALRTFRFAGSKSVDLLIRSCGVKPNGQAYAPLWDSVDIGGVQYYRMHDYLDHNDCRDEVLERLQDADDRAELRKARDRDRKARVREQRQAKLAALRVRGHSAERPPEVPPERPPVSAELPRNFHPPTETAAETPTAPSVLPAVGRSPASARSKRPVYQSDRFAVFEWQLSDLAQMLGPHTDSFDLHGFFDDLSRQTRERGVVIPADREARWAWLRGQVEAEAKRRGLPFAAVVSPSAAPGNKRVAGLTAGGQAFLQRRHP